MFENEIDEGMSFPAFLLQQIGVFLAFVLWGGLGSGWIGSFPLLRDGGPLTAATNAAWGLIPAFFAGRWIRANDRWSAHSGGYIWLLPVGLLVWALISGAVHSTLARDFRDLLYPPHEDKLDGLVVVLFTVPTLGCIGYSVGIWFQGRFRS